MIPSDNKELSREELYERIWSSPMTQVAAELGISDVALAKRCKKLNVPKPPVGYWAKVAAGQTPIKQALPAEPKPIEYEPLDAPVVGTLQVPASLFQLHPMAMELMTLLRAAVPDTDQRLKVENRAVPCVTVSKALIEPAVKALHVILTAVEARGIRYCQSRSKYDVAHFEKGRDRLNLTIEEATVMVTRAPTAQEKRHPTARWQTQFPEPSGKLSIFISTERHAVRPKTWTESDKLPLEEVLAKVVQAICKHYADLEREHAQTAERLRKQWEAYDIQQQEEKKQQHAASLDAVEHMRNEDLLKAAEWWRLHQVTMAFINECEQRWRSIPPCALTAEQQACLIWARESADAMSPFEAGYPNPANDGAFDPAAVPAGGPYPPKRDFPWPPTMPKIPPPVQPGAHSFGHTPEPKQQFPFWLKHPRR
ncbi:MAG: hypothetical protein H6R15_3494 [Proteobacteria bacterium]|nr:hypothetical protein [Pseudomonadota bacterium]